MGSPTSTTDHQRQISNVQGWSAYPPRLSVIADIPARQPSAMSGREQLQQLGRATDLLDHHIGDRENARREGDPERLRSFEVDRKLQLGCLLYRQIARFVTF
jgi:hypothetical protein